MKKLLVLLLCLVTLLSLFSCADSIPPASDESKTEEPSTHENAPSNKDKAPTDLSSAWKIAYLDFLETKKDTHNAYALVSVDGDDVPELYLNGGSEAEGDSVCTYQNGQVIEQYLNRTGGGKYVPNSGTFINVNGHMGLYRTDVYTLDEHGFTKTFAGSWTERFEDLGNGAYNIHYEYFIAETPVSKEEYTAAVKSSFDFEYSFEFYNFSVSYDVIVGQINAWGDMPILSQSVKNTWKSDLVAILSEVDVRDPANSIPGSQSVGLMDLNFDNCPEVLVAWPGGSMGNLFIEIFDLTTHEKLASYDGSYDGHLYVAETNGTYVTLAEGSLRDPEHGWITMIDLLPDTLQNESGYLIPQNLFAKSAYPLSLEDELFFMEGESVSKSQYEEAYGKFLTDYTEVACSQLFLIDWSSLDLSDKDGIVEQMANALIHSPQIFLDFKN